MAGKEYPGERGEGRMFCHYTEKEDAENSQDCQFRNPELQKLVVVMQANRYCAIGSRAWKESIFLIAEESHYPLPSI